MKQEIEKTDDEKVKEKLSEIGAELLEVVSNETAESEADMEINFWNVRGKGLIVINHLDGRCGLYSFAGADGDAVERDLAFIENLAVQEIEATAPKVYYEYWDAGKWYWHARAMNHEIVAQGETNGYFNKADCLHAIDLLRGSSAAEVKERGKS